jgi:hypothetical protein
MRVQRRGFDHQQQATNHRRGDRSLPSGDQAAVLHARLSADESEPLREKERGGALFCNCPRLRLYQAAETLAANAYVVSLRFPVLVSFPLFTAIVIAT